MRIVTEFSDMPQAYTVVRNGSDATVTFYTDVQRVERGEGVVYSAIAWTLDCTWHPSLEERISKNVELWRNRAIEQSRAEAAAEVRARRNELLRESDSRMAIDRLGLAVPDGIAFSEWLNFLRALGNALTGEWNRYRQLLRDLPEQVGFPFDVAWPAKPDENSL